MQKFILGMCFMLAGCSYGADLRINFADFAAGHALTNFHAALAGGGAPGQWKIVYDSVPSAFDPLMPQNTPTPSVAWRPVLAQLSQDPTDERFPMLIYDGVTFKNFTLTEQFKIVSGTAEQMAGIVFRYQNESNFYVLRASALGRNVRFYKVVDGIRGNIIGPEMNVTTNMWHTLSVECDGQQIVCFYDGQPTMPPLQDTSFSSGKIGYWTKSDSVTYFGDTTINYTPIVPAAQALVDSTMKKFPRIVGLLIFVPDANGKMYVLASKDNSDNGKPGTDAEKGTYADGSTYYGHGKGTVDVDIPLCDRNGVPIAAVRVKLKSNSLAENQDIVLARVHIIINEMQKSVLSKEDLME